MSLARWKATGKAADRNLSLGTPRCYFVKEKWIIPAKLDWHKFNHSYRKSGNNLWATRHLVFFGIIPFHPFATAKV